jgi:hypothetical protein
MKAAGNTKRPVIYQVKKAPPANRKPFLERHRTCPRFEIL